MKYQWVRYTKSRFLCLVCWMVVLNAIDALSTALLMLKLGTWGEVNPLWRWLADTWGVDAFFFIKLVYPTVGLYFLHEYINRKVGPLYFLQAMYGRWAGSSGRELFFRKWMIIIWHIVCYAYVIIIASHTVHWILIFCGVLK